MPHNHHEIDLDTVSKRFLELLNAPQHLGHLDSSDGSAKLTGECGDSVGMEISVVDRRLACIRVQPDGCVFTQVCSEAVAGLATGLSLDDVLAFDVDDVVEETGGLPEDHLHCARLALNTLGEAILDFMARDGRKG